MSSSLVLLALVSSLALSCGPTTIEPVPDIPQTVDYDTVKIDYAGQDGVEQPQAGTLTGALVGESSGLAEFTRETVFGTNEIMYGVFELIDRITAYPARQPQEGRWVWETPPRADDYLHLRIDAVDAETFSYSLRWGNSAQDNREIFSGWFTPFETADPQSDAQQEQQGEGLLYLDFDAFHAYDPTSFEGKMAIAFRARNGVRQVRVGFDQFTNGDSEPLNAIYRYVQLPSGRGRLVFFGRGDFGEDGEPHEFFSVDAAWLPDAQGRVAARIEGGTLSQPVVVRQCWDASETIVWEESQPNRPLHDDGSPDACAATLRALTIDPPTYEPPNGRDPDVPEAHPSE
jgi:hypothetical protein